MTVNTNQVKSTYTGNGVATTHNLSIRPILDGDGVPTIAATHVVIATGVQTPWVLDTDYSLNMNTFVVTALAGALPTGEKVVFTYNMPFKQPVQVTDEGFYPSVIETGLDDKTLSLLQLKEELNRAVKVQVGSDTDPAVLIEELTQASIDAEASAAAALVSENNAEQSALDAADAANRLTGTSTTSVAISTGTKVFTTQADKQFNGQNVRVYSAANVANFMDGLATYSGTSLSVDVDTIGGSGTFTDWVIKVNGAKGATGPTGPDGTLEDIAANSVLANATASPAVPVEFTVAASKLLGRAASGDLSNIGLGVGLAFDDTNIVVSRNRAYDQETANTTATGAASVIPIDTSTPLSTEGVEILSVSITPSSNTARLRATAYAVAYGNGSSGTTTALTMFAGSTFLNGGLDVVSTSRIMQNLYTTVEWVPGSTSPVTVSVRFGPSSAAITSYLNSVQTITTNFWGSAQKAVLIVEEL